MESIDRQILTELAKDSSRSLNEIATALGIPSSTLHQKVKKFEAKGLIQGRWPAAAYSCVSSFPMPAGRCSPAPPSKTAAPPPA